MSFDVKVVKNRSAKYFRNKKPQIKAFLTTIDMRDKSLLPSKVIQTLIKIV